MEGHYVLLADENVDDDARPLVGEERNEDDDWDTGKALPDYAESEDDAGEEVKDVTEQVLKNNIWHQLCIDIHKTSPAITIKKAEELHNHGDAQRPGMEAIRRLCLRSHQDSHGGHAQETAIEWAKSR